MRMEGTDVDHRAGTCRKRFRLRRQAAQGNPLLRLVADEIEIVGNGAQLQGPGRNAVLVHGVGHDGRHEHRDGDHQGEDAQCLHLLTRSAATALYGMKPLSVSTALKGDFRKYTLQAQLL